MNHGLAGALLALSGAISLAANAESVSYGFTGTVVGAAGAAAAVGHSQVGSAP